MLSVLLASACQKRKYPEETIRLGDEKLYFDGTVDGKPLSLKIGTDGYYCNSPFPQSTFSVYIFTGELKKYNCNPCPLSFRVDLSDYRVRTGGAAIPIDSVLSPGSRPITTGIPRAETFRFTFSSNKTVASQLWEVDNGFSSAASQISFEFLQPGAHSVSLTMISTGNCESKTVSKVYVDNYGGVFACNVLTATQPNNGAVFTSSVTGGVGPFVYSWYFGDGQVSNQVSPMINYRFAGSYPVTLVIEDANGHQCSSQFVIVVGNDQSSCSANMAFQRMSSRFTFLNGSKLTWTDGDGQIYSSSNVAQPADSYFQIADSQPFEPDDKGNKGRLLTLRFNILLSDGSRAIRLKSENTAIAVTYR